MGKPRILLIGIGGVYNYGCEAIVRGTEAIVHREYPAAEIIYASLRPEDDRTRLSDCNIEIVTRKMFGRYSPPNILRKIASLINIKYFPMLDSLSMLNGFDAVFSIGGDVYTLGPGGGYSMSFPKFGDASVRKGIPYILWGASVGPFSANPEAEEAYSNHLKKVSLITAREKATVEYLAKLGIYENVVPCADPAYVVAPEITAIKPPMNNDIIIGINLSPLSILYSKHPLDDAIRNQARTIESIIKSFKAHVILIPHVVCSFNAADDDYRYLWKIKQVISSEYQKNVSLLDNDPGFVGTKREIINCNLVIAARMHCAINALAAHTPTIFLSYSRKAVGMCHYVYGNEDWVVPIDQLASEQGLESKIRSMLSKDYRIRKYLSKRIPEIQNEAFSPLQRLKKSLRFRQFKGNLNP